jgi:hypothetical protein
MFEKKKKIFKKLYVINFLITFLCFWSLLVWFIPVSTYWRDSPEFIIAARYLDVAHPGGFPLYALLANLFTHIPFGSIAFRVHLFSGFISVLNIFLIVFTIEKAFNKDILHRIGGIRRIIMHCGLILSLFSSPGCVRQMMTAEVYELNLFFHLILLLIYTAYYKKRDERLLYFFSFIAGLSLGNHVSIIFFIFSLFLGKIFYELKEGELLAREVLTRKFLYGVMFSAGLLVYLYIPIRGSHNPPLNSGRVTSLRSFYDHITNKRASALQSNSPASQSDILQAHPQRTLKSFLYMYSIKILYDLRRMLIEFNPYLIPFVIVGVISLCRTSPHNAYVLIAALLTNWLFFLNWDTDPWTVVYAVYLIFSGIGLIFLTNFWSKKFIFVRPFVSSIFVLFFVVLVGLKSSRFLIELPRIKDYAVPYTVVTSELQKIPYEQFYVVEDSWFLAKFLQLIEGVRNDIHLTYLPSLIAPQYFNIVALQAKKDYFVTGTNQIDELKRFINVVAQKSKYNIYFELSPFVYNTFQNVLLKDYNGSVYISYGKYAQNLVEERNFLENSYFESVKTYLLESRYESYKSTFITASDATNYFEIKANILFNYYRSHNQNQKANIVLESVCVPFFINPCTGITLNNLGVSYVEIGEFEKAMMSYSEALSRFPLIELPLRKNIEILKNSAEKVVKETSY